MGDPTIRSVACYDRLMADNSSSTTTEKRWQKVRQTNDYQNDMFFISQLYEEKWEPQPPMV